MEPRPLVNLRWNGQAEGKTVSHSITKTTLAVRLLHQARPRRKQHPHIRQTPPHRQKDLDLAGIRDPAAVAKLPADEQEACKKLWADVAGLLKKLEEKR